MGARGPAPTPTSILNLRGSRVPEYRGAEPTLPVEQPSRPAWLSKEAKEEWKRQTRELERLGVVAKIDRAALAAYCEAWAEFVYAVWAVEHGDEANGIPKGYLTPGSMGNMVLNPMVKVKQSAVDRMLKLAAQFGFTPSARARLAGIGQAPEEDEGSVSGFARKRG